MLLPCAEWTPDRPALSGGNVVASGVVPVASDAYGPIPGPVQSGTGTLGLAPYNAFLAIDQNGGAETFAATVGGLVYVTLGGVGQVWHPLSPGGYATNGTARYAQWKNTVLVNDGSNVPQSWTMAWSGGAPVGSLAAVATTGYAPLSLYIAVAKNFVFVGYVLNDGNGNFLPYRLWWCAFNDPTTWPTPGSTQAISLQSDYNDFNGQDGVITGLASGLLNVDLLIFFQFGLWSATYVGAPNVFTFSRVQTARGVPPSLSEGILVVEGMAYFWGETGFYACDGVNVFPVGLNKVDQWVKKTIYPGGFNVAVRVTSAYDPRQRVLVWLFAQTSVAGCPGWLLFYHKDFQRWTYLATSGVEVAFTALPYVYNPQQRVLGTLDTAGNLSNWTGNNVAAEVSTTEMEPVPGAAAWIDDEQPPRLAGDCGYAATVAMATRYRLQDAQTIGADVGVNVAGSYPQRAEGRYMQALIKVPAGAAWTNVQGLEINAIRSGGR